MFSFISLFSLVQKISPVRGIKSMATASSNKISFNVGTFNLLAPCHKRLNKDQYSWKSRWLHREIELPELFTPRTKELLTVIKAAGPLDVLCLQEFSTDKRIVAMFKDELGSKYNLLQLPRPGNDEGLAMFIDKSIHIVRTVTQDLSAGMSCRVALHALLQVPHLQAKVLVSTTHLEFQHHFMSEKIRQAQVKEILSCTGKLCSEHLVGDDSLVFIMGDFNGSPETGSYNMLAEASFISAHSEVYGLEPQVTHRDHRGNEFTADYIFYNSLCPHTRPRTVDLHPLQYGAEKWPEEFTASDHRLLVAHFEIDQDQFNENDPNCNITTETTRTHLNRQNICSVL